MKSRPVWLDCKGNAWARPNIPEGRGHHWDVYISDTQLAERIGLRQLNVVGFGGPASEGAPGLIHHVPTAKQSRLRDDAGWTC